MFLFSDKFPFHVYYLLQLFDLLSLLFDPVSINLGQVEVEGSYIIHSGTILVKEASLFLKLSDNSQKM